MLVTTRFLFGAAAGYVLGTRAGRERYQEIADVARRVQGSDYVQQVPGELQQLCGNVGNVGNAVGEQMTAVTCKLSGRSQPSASSQMHTSGEPWP